MSAGRGALGAILAIVAAAACDYATMAGTRESIFATHAQAVERGAFDQGLLPQLVPASATELIVRQDDTSGERWLRFQVPQADHATLVTTCTPVARQTVDFPASRTRGLTWWPDLLLADSEALDEQVALFRCPSTTPGGTGWLAAHRALTTVWYWQTPSS